MRAASPNRACYRTDTSATDEESSNTMSSASSRIPALDTKYRKRKRHLTDVMAMREQLMERDEQCHKEMEQRSEQQHQELIQLMTDNNAALNKFASLLAKLVEK
ncbi:hypothetical protein BG011_005500 [Mortierella polycephala]|uniref:Uncharacterized protein n=1 Tax=Mortierella polycephala TaxID=41804 RepID=A0A9P6U186_9FUNG|nr:hypothetical protein BG011_005500 [Mortierella polycephala]